MNPFAAIMDATTPEQLHEACWYQKVQPLMVECPEPCLWGIRLLEGRGLSTWGQIHHEESCETLPLRAQLTLLPWNEIETMRWAMESWDEAGVLQVLIRTMKDNVANIPHSPLEAIQIFPGGPTGVREALGVVFGVDQLEPIQHFALHLAATPISGFPKTLITYPMLQGTSAQQKATKTRARGPVKRRP